MRTAPATPPNAPSAAPTAPNEAPKGLSTDSLVAALRAEFTDSPPAEIPVSQAIAAAAPPAPGSQPSPDADAEAAALAAANGQPPADPATDPAADDDDAAQWPEKAIDTVTALRAERRELRAELKHLVEEMEKAKPAATAPPVAAAPATPQTPLTPDIAAIQVRETQQQNVADWCRTQLRLAARNPEAVYAELEKAGVKLENSPEAVTDFLERTRDTAVQQGAALAAERAALTAHTRQQDEVIRQQVNSRVLELAPELKDPKHARAVEFNRILEVFPNMKTAPQGRLTALVHLLGLEALRQLAPAPGNGNGNGAPKPAPPPPRPRPANAPRTPQPGQKTTSTELFKVFQKSGKPEDKKAWMDATLAEAT